MATQISRLTTLVVDQVGEVICKILVRDICKRLKNKKKLKHTISDFYIMMGGGFFWGEGVHPFYEPFGI